MRRVVALVSVLLPLVVSAESPRDDAATAPLWSIGAGVTFGSPAFFIGSPLVPVSAPAAAASVERAISPRTALVAGVLGTFRRDRAAEDSFVTPSREDVGVALVTAGVRRFVTPRGAPVDVSLHALAEGGTVRVKVRSTSGALDQLSWLAGVQGGIAVERALADRLALRIATPLVGARYTRDRVGAPGEETRTGSDLTIAMLIAPTLELRLAF
jgi:hypothetical protein